MYHAASEREAFSSPRQNVLFMYTSVTTYFDYFSRLAIRRAMIRVRSEAQRGLVEMAV